MGSICSSLREGMDFIVHYLFPQYTPPLRQGYSILPENSVDQQSGESFLGFDESLSTSNEDNANKNGEIRDENREHLGKSNQEIVKNAEIFQDILSNFFRDCNPKQLRNGTAYENKIYTECKMHGEETSLKNRINCNPERVKDEETSGANIFQWDVRNGELTALCERKNENRVDSGLEAENPVLDTGVKQGDSMSSSIRQYNHSNGNSGAEPMKNATEDNLKCNGNFASHHNRKYGMVPTAEVFRYEKHIIDEFERRSSLIDENLDKDKDCDVNVKQACKVRKLALSTMHSGCLYSVGEDNENMKPSDYSQESQPLHVPIDTHERLKNDKLQSGGLVVFEELSKQLSVPNYYAENPIVYDGASEVVKIPQTSPVELPEQRPICLPTSCSGGGIVAGSEGNPSMPDIFPENNYLLKTYTPILSTQCSVSSGTVHREYAQQDILSDLISRSLKYDYFLELRAKHSEILNSSENTRKPTSASAPDIAAIGDASPGYTRCRIKARKSTTF